MVWIQLTSDYNVYSLHSVLLCVTNYTLQTHHIPKHKYFYIWTMFIHHKMNLHNTKLPNGPHLVLILTTDNS